MCPKVNTGRFKLSFVIDSYFSMSLRTCKIIDEVDGPWIVIHFNIF